MNSSRAIAAYALFQAAVCLGTNAIISLAAGVFPVPFSQFTVIIPMTISGRLVFFRHVPDNPEFHTLSDKVNQWLGMETLPILVYPVFTAIFTVLTPTQQLWVSLLLPALKLAVRRALWAVARHDDDLVGVITCCVGHLYHVLFTAVILQNAKSYETLGVVAVFNTAQMLYNCRYILTDAKKIDDTKARLDVKEGEELASTDNLNAVLGFAQHLRIAQNLHWRTPSLLLSTYLGYRSAPFLQIHGELLRATSLYNAVYVYNTPKTAAKRGPRSNVSASNNAGPPTVIAVQRASATSITLGMTRIMPWTGNDNKALRQKSEHVIHLKSRSFIKLPRSKSDPSAWEREEGRLARQEAVIHAVASALHQSEMILLRSYITISMTLFYVVYLQAVFRLKNREYFATLVYLTTFDALDRTICRLLLLCAMESVFLAIYLLLMWRRLGISGVHQLAFVLWSQRIPVQAKLYVTTVILGFPLTHNGNDSILRLDSFE
ncbi:uncharacterized protein IUM83_12958 [Phytophthora cinnamomi]|uniref:uncharacterized protein n=1 Tax=Phytophthora cinnamomi TaxID=4785 RepID=UPI00355A9B1B|nr:hypothetical protein IUM83_12958 [Phytophthora cinnamomi]